jgi:SAM-dependent methyltransferase
MDARAWDERYAASELVWSATPNQFVEAELADLRPGRALDLAAGEGRNALWLADRGWHVTAVDFSLAGLDKGRTLQERHQHGRDLDIDWVHADVLSWECGPVPYDLALLAYLQLTADERRTAVRRAFGALRPGGTFFVIAHDSTNLTEGTGGPTDPAVLFTAEDVLAGEQSRDAYDALVRLVRTA